MNLTIVRATSSEDLAHIKELFCEYQDWLGVDLCFQGFQEELNNLPGKYDCLLLARWNGKVCACVGIWPVLKEKTCEMKRLYVRDAFKGKGVGRTMAEEIIKIAKQTGYSFMCLDTLERLHPAIALYHSLGFENCPPYYDNPLDQVVYLEKTL